MSKVKLGDVVKRVKEFVDKDNTDLLYYIGGEHFDERSLTVTRKGLIKGSTIGPAFSTKFQSGDVLLMSRNPHLRKAGMVDFEGICSDVSYIIRTKDENVIMQKFIPILFQSDAFWTFAERNKKGSTNFFLNWSDFERFEFDLPDHNTQEKLTKTLWSINDTLDSYKEMLKQSDELVKAKFIEMFGNINDINHFERKQWKEVVSVINGKDHKKISGKGQYGVYGTGGRMLDASEYFCDAGTIIMGRKGTIDKPYIAPEKCWVVDTAFGVTTKDLSLNQLYLYYYTKQLDYSKLNKACTLPSTTKSDLLELWINIPPVEEQNVFAKFFDQIDKSKFGLQECITKLETLYEKIVNKYLTKEETV
mgnify:CR=1 FL=1